MAKKKKTQRRQEQTSQRPAVAPAQERLEGAIAGTPVQVDEVDILWETEPAPLYSNFAAASVRPPGEFSLTLCALSNAPPYERDGKLVVGARIVAQVRMHPNAFFALTALMCSQWNALVDREGLVTAKFQVVPPSQPAQEEKDAGNQKED